MGHFHEEVKAVGKNQKDAEQNAASDFYFENGHRHDIRDITPLGMVKVPPKKWVKKTRPSYSSFTGRRGSVEVQTYEPDPDAPESEWEEEWTFEIHSHA